MSLLILQVEAFVKGMQDGGVVLEEPEPYRYDTKPEEYFPEYVGKDHAGELQNVRKELDATREQEFKNYDFSKSDENSKSDRWKRFEDGFHQALK